MFNVFSVGASFLVYVLSTWHYYFKNRKTPLRYLMALLAGLFSGQLLIKFFSHSIVGLLNNAGIQYSSMAIFFTLVVAGMVAIPVFVLLFQKIFGISTYVETMILLGSLTALGNFADTVSYGNIILMNICMFTISVLSYIYTHKDFEKLIENLRNGEKVNGLSATILMYVLTVTTLLYSLVFSVYGNIFFARSDFGISAAVVTCSIAGICTYFFSVRQLIRILNGSIENDRLNHEIHEADTRLIKGKQKMLDSQESVIAAFADILENKSGESGGHVKRVALYSEILAEEMGLSEEKVHIIKIASMMHDVGKILVPNEILEKKGRFTYEEREAMKLHVDYGDRILGGAKGEIMTAARNIAKEHHERWDGKGYLYGLSKDEISIEAQIVSVADVFDALTSKRCYKDAWDIKSSYREIVDGSGTQFSPAVVEAFKKGFDRFREVMISNPDAQGDTEAVFKALNNTIAS
ncbi:HD domain-containing protein [Lachnospiraceae bacterium]|nr:HD domain-containing protein [Lachnospiraceae bacterium]